MTATTTSSQHRALAQSLADINQQHLLTFYDDLSERQRAALLDRIAALDLDETPALIKKYVVTDSGSPAFVPSRTLDPAPYYPADCESAQRPWDRASFLLAGEELIAQGKIALFTVAGGQGTRLGYDGPKGCYPATPALGKPLFRLLAEWVIAASERYNAIIPWYIMTSPANHEQTVRFFEDQNWFNLDRAHVMHFQQGVMPSFQMETGAILLDQKDAPATNPDGHGGSLRALHRSGALEDMRRRGVEHLSYTQIDNPLIKAIDPVFIGLHAAAPDSSAEMSSKMVEKTLPEERVGVFCLADGKTSVVEYSDLPDKLASQRRDDGALRFNAGSPAIHMISVDFIRRLNEGDADFALPFHRAQKKVPFINLETGKRIEPDSPNAVKLEMFVFDALPFAHRSIVLETPREEEFAPIKNKNGADSPATSQALQSARAAHWLEIAGVAIPRTPAGDPDCTLEVSPLVAMSATQLKEQLTQNPSKIPTNIAPGDTVVIEP